MNKNGRKYSISLMEREVNRYTKECINENRSFGELGHPNPPTVNLDRVALMVKELRREGNNYIGKAKITENLPMGAIAKGLIDEGARLGVSSRGVGSLKPNPKGWSDVAEDFRLCVCSDLVSDPSGPGCMVSAVLENVEWLYDPASGTWLEEKLDNTKKELHSMTREQMELRALGIFEELLHNISGLKVKNNK